MFASGILREYRCASEAKYLQVLEEIHDILMTLAKMAAMTFIENHHNLLVFHLLQMLVVVVSGDGTVQFLDGGDDDF